MKKVFFIIIGTLLFGQVTQNEQKIIKEIALNAHEQYANVLRNAMKSKLKQEGAAKAISYCYDSANFLTMTTSSKLSRKLKVKVKLKRISFKNRNPYGYPNKNDKKILEQMQKQKMPENKIVLVETKNEIRAYQPLYVKKVCLKCHGSNIDPKVKKVLSKYYSHDKAFDYKEGDFRGAIVVTINKKSLQKLLQKKNLQKEQNISK